MKSAKYGYGSTSRIVGFKKFLFKSGFGFNGSSKEFFDSVTGSFRVNDIREYYFKAGLEYEFFKENKWVGYTGIDAVFNMDEDKVTSQGFNEVIIKNAVVQYGGGPVLGLKYYLNKRLYLSTEATLYGFVAFTDLTQEENGVEVILTEKTDFLGSLQSPLFLYINYRLWSNAFYILWSCFPFIAMR